MPQLSNITKWTKVADHTSAGTSQVNSASVDMQGWDGVMFVTSYGTAASDNILHLATSSDDSTFNDLEGTALSPGASDEDQWVDIYRPLERYIRAEAVRDTSSTLESVWAVQYAGARKQPVSNVESGTIIGEAHVSPAEGTA
tara:strand:+ start:253 stop:678 length:426 start_codon:yes stop_codon:yes gene_type:complete